MESVADTCGHDLHSWFGVAMKIFFSFVSSSGGAMWFFGGVGSVAIATG